jgi:hypothetical protein
VVFCGARDIGLDNRWTVEVAKPVSVTGKHIRQIEANGLRTLKRLSPLASPRVLAWRIKTTPTERSDLSLGER